MRETENAVLYLTVPSSDDDAPETVGLLLDEAALSLLVDDTLEGERELTALVVDDRAVGSVAQRYPVLETARRWFGPVLVIGPADADGRLPIPSDGTVRLRIAGALHVPGRLRGSDVQ